jgi:hypothetical protein
MGKGGGGGGPQTSTAYQTNLPEYAKPYVMNMLGAAQNQLFTTTPGTAGEPGEITGFKPYTPYSTDPTNYFAGPSSLQRSVYNEAGQMQTPGQFGAASGLAGAAGMGQLGTTGQAGMYGQQGAMFGGLGTALGAAGAMQAMPAFGAGQQYAQQVTDPRSMQSYMSPYQQAVTDVAKSAAIREAQLAQQATNLGAARQGTYGGARQALMQGERERNLLANLSNIQAQGSQSAYDKAMQAQQFGANLGLQGIQTGLQGVQQGLAGTAQGMQGAGLGLQGVGAQQAGFAGAGQAASTLGQLGGAQQQADLARLGFQQQTGQQQQQYQQNIINQAIQDYATQQQYPFMQLSTMSNLLRGLPMQGMSTQQYQAAPSVTSQLAGLGTAGVGAYGLGRATGIFKEGGQVKGYKYGGAIDDDKLRSMAENLSAEQLQAQLRDPSLDAEERQIFADALRNKQPTPGLGALRAPTFSAAGGGIVAFQEGDLVEDDDSSAYGGYINESDDDELIDSVLAAGVPAGAYGYASRGLGGVNPEAPSGSGIRADAKAPRGIEGLTAYVLNKESGGRRYDKSGNLLTSSKGAEGEMQVMPMTQRDPGFGVKAARDNSPEEKARVGRDYLAALYDKYGDEKLAAIAYNMGPGATDKWLKAGADVSKLPKETRGYIAQLAGGGMVSFQAGGTMDGFGEVEREEEITYDPYFAEGMFSGYTRKAPISAVGTTVDPKTVIRKTSAAKQAPVADPTAPAARDEAAEAAELQARKDYEAQLAQGQKDKEIATAGTSKLEDILTRREQNLEKQGAIDSNLALLMAGLGMAGGTSKNALENIAKGAQLGTGTYMAGAKQRAAGENALMAGRLGLEKMRGLQDIRQQQMTQNLEGKIGSQIGAREKQIEQFAYNLIAGKGSMVMDSAEAQAAVAKEVQRLKSQDPLLGKLYSQYGLPPIQSAGAPATMSKEQLIAKAKAEKERLGIN